MKSISVKNRVILLFVMMLVSQLCVAKTVRLITIGPGDAFWSAFGHTALAIDDEVYGFGYFSFDMETIQSFVTNSMMYEMGISEINYEALLAEQQNRTFSVITLNLDPVQVEKLSDYLSWHYQPQNQTYQYDYFLNNCSTKIRDILQLVWPNDFAQNSQGMTQQSYFDHTFPAKHQGLMNFGFAVGYGWPAYQHRNQWELMAFPVFLEQHLQQLDSDAVGPRQVSYETQPSPLWENVVKTHWTLILYVVLWTIVLMPKNRTRAAKTWFVWHGLIGLVLLSGWLLTPHQVMAWNFNLLLFSPLGLLMFLHRIVPVIIIVGWGIWLVLSLYLGAWYLIPLLLPGCLAWRNHRSSQDSGKGSEK